MSNTNLIGHTLRRNSIVKRVIDRKIERRIKVIGRRGRRSKQLLGTLWIRKHAADRKRKHRNTSVENSCRKKLWTCRKTGYVINQLGWGQRGSRVIGVLVLSPCTILGCAVNATSRMLYPRERTPVSILYAVVWASGLVESL